jgi:hypothetical protein
MSAPKPTDQILDRFYTAIDSPKSRNSLGLQFIPLQRSSTPTPAVDLTSSIDVQMQLKTLRNENVMNTRKYNDKLAQLITENSKLSSELQQRKDDVEKVGVLMVV